MGPLTESANEFASFELARLGYDLKSGQEVASSQDDADDLLLLVLGDRLDPKVFAGVAWAVKNRPVSSALHLAPDIYTAEQRSAPGVILQAAGLPS
jgi:hypothetical protein